MSQQVIQETRIMPNSEPAAGMLCPLDKTSLVMSERQGIEIDYCPTCRGVWLDRGELDKILERSAAEGGPARQPARPTSSAREEYLSPREYGEDRGHRHGGHRKPKKSFLSELFD